MTTPDLNVLFTKEKLQSIFPAERANEFFEALYGDVEEGVYDISLEFSGYSPETSRLVFHLNLTERPGKCLACNLPYGLPEVFSRHPIININGVVDEVDALLGDSLSCNAWSLGSTQPVNKQLYKIPLTIEVS